ncbi:MAG: hypothetical protein FWD13_01260 [Treponema sp.]|nr:hypothetical protein [Treponema sp.]
MKNTLRMVVAITLIMVVAFAMVGCDSPKSLAKQSLQLEKDFEKAYAADDEKKIEQLEKKQAQLTAKIEKLSMEKQLQVMAEYIKLRGGSLF